MLQRGKGVGRVSQVMGCFGDYWKDLDFLSEWDGKETNCGLTYLLKWLDVGHEGKKKNSKAWNLKK